MLVIIEKQNIETAVKPIIMGEISKCEKCELGFPSVGSLKSEARLQQHKRTPHRIPCGEYYLVFISMTHVRFHLHYTHDCWCPHCYTFCEGSCSGYYGLATEAAGSEAMEAEEMDKNSIIKDTETTLEKWLKK